MMEQKNEKEDEEYESKQKGFDWGDDTWPVSSEELQYSSETQKNAAIKQVDLLRYDGLDEVAENTYTKSPEKSEPSYLSSFILETSKTTLNIAESHHLLVFKTKNKEQPNKLMPAETVKRMILGMEYTFEHFRGKNEKLELLSEAVNSHDGNAILAAVLFLRRTLKKAIFQHELIKFPAAVNMYLSYLEEDHETDELANMLLLLGRTEKAAMLKYQTAISVKNVESKIKWLENCLSTHFQPDSVGNLMSSAVSQHYLNLNMQNNLVKFCMDNNSQENDENLKSIYEEITGKCFAIDTSVLSTMLFSCLYCYSFPETNQFSPPSLKKVYNLNSNQYTWTVIRALAASKKWPEIQDLLYSKNWLGGKKMKCCIGFPNLLTVLSKHDAPQEVLEKYVFYVEDEEKRLTLAKKYNCHSLVINILKAAKDRVGLAQYATTLKPHSIEYCNVTQALNSQNIKWKN